MAYVIDAEERAVICRNQTRDAIGCHAIIACMTDTHSHAPNHLGVRYCLDRSRLAIDLHRSNVGRQSSSQRSRGIHLDTYPEEIQSGEELLVAGERNGVAGRANLSFADGIAGISFQRRTRRIAGDVFHGGKAVNTAVLPCLCPGIIEFQCFDIVQLNGFAKGNRYFVQRLALRRFEAQLEQDIVVSFEQDGDLRLLHEYRIRSFGREDRSHEPEGK